MIVNPLVYETLIDERSTSPAVIDWQIRKAENVGVQFRVSRLRELTIHHWNSTSYGIHFSSPYANDPTKATINRDDTARYLAQTAWQQLLDGRTSPQKFVEVIEAADQLTRPTTVFLAAIELAVAADAARIARLVAQHGHDLYPDNGALRQAAQTLALPRTVETDRRPQGGQALTMKWLREHSREYQGAWVAVQDGKLVGTASSRKALVKQLGNSASNAAILITRVP